MKAMILAAGRGERMRPLTDTCPKPLLKVRGKALIDYHLDALSAAGFTEVVINTAWLGEMIESHVEDGSRWSVRVYYSHEGWPALETGGGIYRALQWLGEQPFLVMNADVWTNWKPTYSLPTCWDSSTLAHLVLVPNPLQHPNGDFGLNGSAVLPRSDQQFTYSGISYLNPTLFKNCSPGAFKLAPLLYEAAHNNRVTGELFTGIWSDVGTPERMALLG